MQQSGGDCTALSHNLGSCDKGTVLPLKLRKLFPSRLGMPAGGLSQLSAERTRKPLQRGSQRIVAPSSFVLHVYSASVEASRAVFRELSGHACGEGLCQFFCRTRPKPEHIALFCAQASRLDHVGRIPTEELQRSVFGHRVSIRKFFAACCV